MSIAVAVKNLTKNYGTFPAVKGIDFEIRTGEVFGLLGPNGAGKTTTVEILEGLRPRSGGEVSVLGIDPGARQPRLKDRDRRLPSIDALADKITVARSACACSRASIRVTSTATPCSNVCSCGTSGTTAMRKLSGGQKQRLALALALVNDPQMLFLDEPSSGLDPQARHEIHQLVQEWRAERRTILLTTHYIEEAERLCDRVAIIDEGRIIAMGTPAEVQARDARHQPHRESGVSPPPLATTDAPVPVLSEAEHRRRSRPIGRP